MNARPGRQVSNGEESRLAFQPPLCKAAMMILPAFTWESGLGWDPNLCALVRPRRPLFSGLSWSLKAFLFRGSVPGRDSKGVVVPATR